MIYANCSICGNKSGYDKESLKGSKVKINGQPLILCCPCEDELLVKLAKRRNIKIKLGDGGEPVEVITNITDDNNIPFDIKLPIYYFQDEDTKKVVIDDESMVAELEDKIKILKTKFNNIKMED